MKPLTPQSNALYQSAAQSFQQGVALYSQGQLELSISKLTESLSHSLALVSAGHSQFAHTSAMVRNQLGIVLADQGSYLDAEKQLDLALSDLNALIKAGQRHLRADAAMVRGNMANVLRLQCKLPESLEQIRRAIQDYAALQPVDGDFRADLARSRNTLANALSESGEVKEAIKEYALAIAAYQSLIDAGQVEFCPLVPGIRDNMAIALIRDGNNNLPDALKEARRAIQEYQALINPPQSSRYLPDVARVRGHLAMVLSRGGRIHAASEEFSETLRIYTALADSGQGQYRAAAAEVRNHFATALMHGGSLLESATQYRKTLGEYQMLVDAGQRQLRYQVAGVRSNLAQVLGLSDTEEGGPSECLEQFRAAIEEFQILINSGQERLCEVARVRGSYANALKRKGQLSDALAAYRLALADYLALIGAGKKHLLSDAARVRADLARALFEDGQMSFAVHEFRGALQMVLCRIGDAGQAQLCGDAAVIRGDLAIALLADGKHKDALHEFSLALEAFCHLLQGGQRQFAVQTSQAANHLAQLAWAQLNSNYVTPMDRNNALKNLESALHALGRLNTIHTTDSQRLVELQRTLATCELYGPMCAQGNIQYLGLADAVITVCAAWLNQAADLLAHGHPFFLRSNYEARIKPMLASLLAILVEKGEAAPIALWHLRTQGLRAQRQAIAAGMAHDPALAELDRLYSQLEQLDRQLLLPSDFFGQPLFTLPVQQHGFHHTAHDASASQWAHATQSRTAERERIWAELQALEEKLQASGQLPETKRLDLQHLGQRLQALQSAPAGKNRAVAVLLLMPFPKDDKRLLAVCVQAGAQGSGLDYQVSLHHTELRMGEQALVDALDCLGHAAHGGHRAVRGWTDAPVPQSQSAVLCAKTEAEMGALRRAWEESPDVLHPVLRDLRAHGITEVSVIPSGRFHLAPWAARLDKPLLRVRQFATTAGWLRVMGEPAAEPAPAQWASLAYNAADDPVRQLPWVAVEALALQHIWCPPGAVPQNSFNAIDRDNPLWPPANQTHLDPVHVQCLQGIGHGGAAGTVALTGLYTGFDIDPKTQTKVDRYFTGLDLHRIKEAWHLVLSCCILGRLHDGLGEPLGISALAFAFKTKFAVGATIPIPDCEGFLFSAALHHAWAGAESAALARGHSMDWSAVFHATRRGVMNGQWPPGFGEFLETQLYALAFEDIGDELRNNRYIEWDIADPKDGPKGRIKSLSLAPSPAVRAVASMFICLG